MIVFFTVLLKIYLIALQAYKYTIADPAYGSNFFIATGFHGLRIFIGLGFTG